MCLRTHMMGSCDANTADAAWQHTLYTRLTRALEHKYRVYPDCSTLKTREHPSDELFLYACSRIRKISTRHACNRRPVEANCHWEHRRALLRKHRDTTGRKRCKHRLSATKCTVPSNLVSQFYIDTTALPGHTCGVACG